MCVIVNLTLIYANMQVKWKRILIYFFKSCRSASSEVLVRVANENLSEGNRGCKLA